MSPKRVSQPFMDGRSQSKPWVVTARYPDQVLVFRFTTEKEALEFATSAK